MGQWQFDANHLQGDSLRPALGPWEGKVLGTAKISNEKPVALEADKEFRGIVLHEDISKAKLPEDALSVTAWTLIDKVIEWGGILGALQDKSLLPVDFGLFCAALYTSYVRPGIRFGNRNGNH